MNILYELLPSQKQQQSFSIKQQQELKILEMSNYELITYIEEELEKNPILEQDINFETGYIKNCEQNFELMMNYVVKEKTLSEEIQEQIRLYRGNLYTDLAIFLSDMLNDNGYLLYNNKQLTRYFPQYSIDDVEHTIQILQTFEPFGIFARDLHECLLIQLENCSDKRSHLAITLINNYIKELSENKIPYLAEKLDTSIKEIEDAYSLIRTLNPKPGSSYSSTSSYLNPDVYVFFEQEEIKIELLRKNYGLHINSHLYKEYDAVISTYLNKHKHHAEMLLSYIDKRNNTILKVVQQIIKKQSQFFLYGDKLKPCTMKEIANQLQLHESTISRCINAKSLIFNDQIIPLKYFFPKSLQNESTDKITSSIKDIILTEDKHNPYSDQKICDILIKQGYKISRRTVTKYREQLKLPSASKRKNYL